MAPPKTPQPPFDSQLILDREKWPMKPGEFTVSICKMCCIYMYLRTRRKILEQESVSLFHVYIPKIVSVTSLVIYEPPKSNIT